MLSSRPRSWSRDHTRPVSGGLGLGLGLEPSGLGLGLGLEPAGLGLGLGLERSVLVLVSSRPRPRPTKYLIFEIDGM